MTLVKFLSQQVNLDFIGTTVSLDNFDMQAASLRSNATNQKAYIEALASKLESSLPGMVTVQRRVSLFAKGKTIKQITVHLAEDNYELLVDKSSSIQATICHKVRNIVLKTEIVTIKEWLQNLNDALSNKAEDSSQDDNVLEDFLL